jgi:hypothetical protein
MYQQTNPIYQNSKAIRDMVLLLMLWLALGKIICRFNLLYSGEVLRKVYCELLTTDVANILWKRSVGS